MADCGTITVVATEDTDTGSGGDTGDDTDGGKGGTGGTGADDESLLVFGSINRRSPSPEELNVTYEVINQIISGGGQTKSATVIVEVDGTVKGTDTLGEIAPEERPTGSIRIDNVEPGRREVCLRIE